MNAGTPAEPVIDRLSTHVLDTTAGRPAAGIPATLERLGPDGMPVGRGNGITDTDGRIQQINTAALTPGEYRATLNTSFTALAYDRNVPGRDCGGHVRSSDKLGNPLGAPAWDFDARSQRTARRSSLWTSCHRGGS